MSKRAAISAAVLCFALSAGAGGAAAQTSSELVHADPPGQYAAIKLVLEEMYDDGAFPRPAAAASRPYNLNHCGLDPFQLGGHGPVDPVTYRYAALAYDILLWSRSLQRIGYPEAVWGAELAAYEAAGLDLLEQQADRWWAGRADRREALREALLEPLQRYRESHPEARPVESHARCGGLPALARRGLGRDLGVGLTAERNVRIATEPPGAQVLFIPTFFYELCRAQQLDPEDTVRCNRWREAVDGVPTQVAGDYMYVARWPDGVLRRGRLSFTRIGAKDTIVLRKPDPGTP